MNITRDNRVTIFVTKIRVMTTIARVTVATRLCCYQTKRNRVICLYAYFLKSSRQKCPRRKRRPRMRSLNPNRKCLRRKSPPRSTTLRTPMMRPKKLKRSRMKRRRRRSHAGNSFCQSSVKILTLNYWSTTTITFFSVQRWRFHIAGSIYGRRSLLLL